jgi:hypothetical protein
MSGQTASLSGYKPRDLGSIILTNEVLETEEEKYQKIIILYPINKN